MQDIDFNLYHKTPTVHIFDNRGQNIREIAFHRTTADGNTDVRITHHRYNISGYQVESIDPRLHDVQHADPTIQPNFHWQHDLAGNILHTKSVDSGNSFALNDIEGRPIQIINAQKVNYHYQYETAPLTGRLLSVDEQSAAEVTSRTIERLIWAGNTSEEKAHNLAGKCFQHYDAAGLTQLDSVSLTGIALSQIQQLLAEGQHADWQDEDATHRHALLDSTVYITQSQSDATGALLTQTDAGGNKQRLAYNIAGQLKSSWLMLRNQSEQVIVKALDYSAAGQKLREEHGNGVITEYTYEPETQRLMGIKTRRQSDNRLLQDLRYDYDPVGNIIIVSNDAEATRFWHNQQVIPENRYTYDSLYQLMSATGREMAGLPQQPNQSPFPNRFSDDNTYTNYTRTYDYDRGGNLTQIRHNAANSQNNHTTKITISNRTNHGVLSSLADDPNKVDTLFSSSGQQISLLPGQQLIWDTHGRLQQVVSPSTICESYRYGSDGMRMTKIREQNQQHQQVIYLPELELRTTQNNGTTTESLQIITLGEAGRAQVRILHWKTGKPDGISNNQIRYSYDNLLGSSQLELDNEGQVISQEEYYPFGGTSIWAARNQTEANYKTIRYSGKERDETGLYYYGYRYYQPWAGRWLSADPAGTVDGLNLYRMVRNNPVTLTDNDGLAPSPNRNHNTFWFATFLFRRSDEGMSKSMRRGQKIGRAIAGGLAIGGLAATIAVTAGAAIPVILGVAAIGFGIGALLGFNVGRILEKAGGLLARFLQGRSTLLQAAAGAAVGAASAASYGATTQGTAIATAAGTATGAIGALINNADSGMGGAIGAGTAVGTIDTMMGSSVTLTHEVGAAAGGAAGGMLTGTSGSTRAGINAGTGTYYGSWVGFGLDVASNPTGHLLRYGMGHLAGRGAEMAMSHLFGGGLLGRLLGRLTAPLATGLIRQAVQFGISRPFFEPIFSFLGGLAGGIGTGLQRRLGREHTLSRMIETIGSGIDRLAGMIGNRFRGQVLWQTGLANLRDYGMSALNAGRRMLMPA
ncbi:RHS repeat protein [Xenorhabdus bovienii]|uniref:RHS repeat protein n=1 Tax=Xenorhabdus bovienii TaxID=40576 RepID=UPI0023B20E16|nr:RHS repeat-associated core domain-containing protein [Xenorhabdus bovienii]MDE9543202.1 RHS repeat protein [Xenorhabdus bovienii]